MIKNYIRFKDPLQRVLFLLLLLPVLLITKEHSQGPEPSWVKPIHLTFDSDVGSSQTNLQHLLIDTQRHLEKKTLYFHTAVKLLTQIGVEEMSTLSIDFDPAYTKITMHNIRIFRNGQWHDRLKSARINLIQREANLESCQYNGELSLVYFLKDIRKGDVIEYSYSKVGGHPIDLSHYTDLVYMQKSYFVNKIAYRLLADPERCFSIKPVNLDVEPQILNIGARLREWVWEASDVPAYFEEDMQPAWYDSPAYLQMSQYSSWKEVAQKAFPLYKISTNCRHFIPKEMKAIVDQWQTASSSPTEQALYALRFVQDEIRYLSFADGIRGFQPADPRSTFQNRFGDCKDKAFLLHFLLDLMGIASNITLVNTDIGKTIPDMLPALSLFNHAVLQIKINNTTYWVDPTCTLQRGPLESNFFPDYKWGLVLSTKSEGLASLPEPTPHPTEINTEIAIQTERLAHLTTTSTYYGDTANQIRQSLNCYGAERISEHYLSNIQRFYKNASMLEEMDVVDDQDNNIIKVTEYYETTLPDDSKEKNINIFPETLINSLITDIQPLRLAPYELSYPHWIKERIHIKSPFIKWQPEHIGYQKKHESMVFDYSASIGHENVTLYFEIKHLNDIIPAQSVPSYTKIVDEILEEAPVISVSSPETLKKRALDFDPNRFLTLSLIAISVWILLGLWSKKVLPTRDDLRFQIYEFQVFYTVGVTFNSIAIANTLPIVFIVITALFIHLLTHYVFAKYPKAISVMLFLLRCNIFFVTMAFVVSAINVPLTHGILGFMAYALFMSRAFITLKAIRAILRKNLYKTL